MKIKVSNNSKEGNSKTDKKLWAQIIAEQFKIQTGVSIHSLIPQKTLNLWLKTKKDL